MVVASRHISASQRDEAELDTLLDKSVERPDRHHFSTLTKVLATTSLFLVLGLIVLLNAANDDAQLARGKSCDTLEDGYTCSPEISRSWGQYSPYFRVHSEVQDTIPDGCKINFVSLLSRHGARDPTATRSAWYKETVDRIKSSVPTDALVGKYAFLRRYEYTLGADQLNDFGRQQLVNTGIWFARRYASLAKERTPFVRAASQRRVVESAEKFNEGYLHETTHSSRRRHGRKPQDPEPAIPITVIWEGAEFNNTLDASRCTAFESGAYSHIHSAAKAEWASHFIPPILARLSADLPSSNLDTSDVLNLLSLCPFDTVADKWGTLSPFCALFTPEEFHQYNHYENLDKYYGYGAGNPLGPTQGVGWTNELIARLSHSPVRDSTSTNSTLDSNPDTFPLERGFYADFSHDNDLTSAFFALGLFDDVPSLRNNTVDDLKRLKGWGSSRTVPFAGRAVVEAMDCDAGAEGDTFISSSISSSSSSPQSKAASSPSNVHEEEAHQDKKQKQNKKQKQTYIRILVNGQVNPLTRGQCGANPDKWGRCKLHDFLDSLDFARKGGRWDECWDA